MYQRTLNLSKSQSFFLFGARGTGKSELLKALFSEQNSLYLDLLDPELADQLIAYPNDLKKRIEPYCGVKEWILIDEVQKAPALLEIVHSLISSKKFKFALTGSSARKLKRGAANLLAGRAVVFNLFPLTATELAEDFELGKVLQFGSLPEVFNLKEELEIKRYLKAYAQNYLKEEIIEEQIVRRLPPFRRFLDIVGIHTSEIVSYTNIARDINSDPKTVQRYYEILEDTLLGFFLPSYEHSIRKQQKKSKKFYFFDTGVARVLSNKIDQPLLSKSFEYGQLFETFIVNEIFRQLSYQERQFRLSFLRVSETQEIDLIIEKTGGQLYLCEIKSADKVDERHAKTLNTLGPSFKNPELIVISNDPVEKKFGQVSALHWRQAISVILS